MRLIVTVDRPEHADLVDRELIRDGRYRDLFQLWTGDVTTPAGLPLNVLVECDRSRDEGSMVIKSAGAALLQLAGVRANCTVTMLLPTDEQLGVVVCDRDGAIRNE